MKKCEDVFLRSAKELSREEAPNQTLEQFRHSMNGAEAECEFEGQTEGFARDIILPNILNESVQRRFTLNQNLLHTKPYGSLLPQKRSYYDRNRKVITIERDAR